MSFNAVTTNFSKPLSLISIAVLVGATGFSSALNASELDLSYHSKYVSEGRNNLASGGITWLSFSTALDDLWSVNSVYGNATSNNVDYDELNLSIEFASSYSNSSAPKGLQFDYYVAYTRLEFFEDDAYDNEMSAGFSLANTKFGLTPFADFVYSTEANGSYVEFGGRAEYSINDKISLQPYIKLAFDFGYANAEHNGFNHAAIGTSINYIVSSKIRLMGIVEQNIGGDIISQELSALGSRANSNQNWAGVHLNFKL